MSPAINLARQLEAVAACHQVLFPAPWLALGLICAAVWLAWSGRPRADRATALILGLAWLAGGLGYLWHFLAPDNPMARVLGALLALQGGLFLAWGLWPGPGPGFWPRRDGQGVLGAAMIGYGLVLLPLIDLGQGLDWRHLPLAGLFPTPTAIVSFGLLLWTRRPVPLGLLLIPIAWALMESYAAIVLGRLGDAGLAVAGVAACALLLPRFPGPKLHW